MCQQLVVISSQCDLVLFSFFSFSDRTPAVAAELPESSSTVQQDLLQATVVYYAGAVPDEVCVECQWPHHGGCPYPYCHWPSI